MNTQGIDPVLPSSPSAHGEQLREEAEFADAVYAQHAEDLTLAPWMLRMYTHPRGRWHWRDYGCMLLGPVAGKRLFDMGCGMGEEACYFAYLGAQVDAWDVSPTGIELTRRRAAFNGLQLNAQVGDVLNTGLAEGSFDIVHGFGILHHIGLEGGLREAHRLLRPGGKALFFEHMSGTGLVRRLRDLYTHYIVDDQSTDYEQPLTWHECVEAGAQYENFQLHPYRLLNRLRRAVPLFDRDWVIKLDAFMMRCCPPLKHFAGTIVIYLEK
jgi:SAM-dependent methyltransferase